jgi:hypothetical protein
MVYARKFISSLTKIVNLSFGKILLADLVDDIVQMGEDRVIMDISSAEHFIGKSFTYQDLLTLNGATFTPLLEYASIFAIMSWFNQNSKNNQAVGPITSVSGDGMAKTQNYFNSKGTNPDSLVSAEDNYLMKIKQIYRYYALMATKKNMFARWNEHYDQNFNDNFPSNRKYDGNVYPGGSP